MGQITVVGLGAVNGYLLPLPLTVLNPPHPEIPTIAAGFGGLPCGGTQTFIPGGSKPC